MNTNVASILGIKGKLCIRQHPNTQKAHVILKRVELEDDSDDEEERPEGAVYYSLFAAKRFEVKPGKEILLSIEGAMDGRAILFQGNGHAGDAANEETDSLLPLSDTEDTGDVPLEDSDAPLPPKLWHRFYTSGIEQNEDEDTHKPTKCSIGVQASPECASFAVQASPPTSSSGVQATSTLCLQLSQATPIVFDASVSTYTSTESVAVQATSTGNGLGFTPTSSDHTNSTLVDILPDSGSIKGEALPPFYSPRSPIYSPVRGRSLSPMELDTPTISRANSPVTEFSATSSSKSPTDADYPNLQYPTEATMLEVERDPNEIASTKTIYSGPATPVSPRAQSSPLIATGDRHHKTPPPVASSSRIASTVVPPKLPRALAGLSPRAREKAPQALPRLASVGTFENPLAIKPSRAVSISTSRVITKSAQPPVKKRKVVIDTKWFPDKKPISASTKPDTSMSPVTLPPPPSEPPPEMPPSPPSDLSEEKNPWSMMFPTKKVDKVPDTNILTVNPLADYDRKSIPTHKSLLDVFVPAMGAKEKESAKEVLPARPPSRPVSSASIASAPTIAVNSSLASSVQKLEQLPYAPAFVPRRLLSNGSLREKEMAPINLKRSPVDTISRSIASPSPAPSPVTPTLVTVPSPPQVVSAESSVKAPQIKKAAQPLAPQSSLIPSKPLPAFHPLPPKPKIESQTNGFSQKKGSNGNAKSHNKRGRSPSPEPTPRRSHSWLTLRCYHSVTLQGAGNSISIEQISFSADGASFALKCADRTVRIWSANQRSEIARLAHNSPVLSVTWLESDTGVMVLGADGVVGQWLKQGQNQWQWSTVVMCEPDHSAKHDDLQLAYHKDRIAVASLRSGVRLWFWQKGQWRAQGSINRLNVTSIRFVEDGMALLGGTRDGVVWYCQVPHGTLRAYNFLKKSIQHIDTDLSGNNALVSGENFGCLVRLRAADSGGPKAGDIARTFALPAHNKITGKAAALFVAQGQGVVFGCVDGCLLVWDTRKGTLVYGLEHESEKDGISSVAVNNAPSGCILTGTTAGILRWWSQPATNSSNS